MSYNGTRLLMTKNPNEACKSCGVEIEFQSSRRSKQFNFAGQNIREEDFWTQGKLQRLSGKKISSV